MLGIGLGSFADGLEKGIGIREKLDKQRRQREIDSSIDEATAAGKADHEAAVEAGTAKRDDADSILRFTMPRMIAPLIKAGDMKSAQAASEWLRSDTTRQGTKAWGEGMLLAKAGDTVGAIKKFVAAARTKGYGADFEIGEPQTSEDGAVSVPIKLSDGRTVTQQFKSPDDVLRFGAAYLNPEAAFKSWQDQQEEARKRQQGLDDYAKRKDIDITAEQRKQALGLGTPAYEAQNVIGTGPDGKPVVKPYVFDRRKGVAAPMRDADGNDISGEVARPGRGGTASGSRRPFQFEVIRDAYKQLGYSDEDATNIAAGRKPPRDVELVNLSRHLTTMEMPSTDMRFKPEQRRARQEEILQGLRQQYQQRGRSNLTGPGKEITGIEVRNAPALPPAPRNAADRKVGQVYAAPDGRKVEWTGQGWKVVP